MREAHTLRRRSIGLGTQRQPSEFAQRMLGRAADLGMAKAQLAAKAGLSRQTLDNLLNFAEGGGAAMPAIRTFVQLGQALRVHPAWLIEGLFSQLAVDTPVVTRLRAGRSPNVEDLNFAQGAVVAPGTRLSKGWRIHHQGTRPWQGLRLVCQDRRITLTSHRSGQPLHATSSLVADDAERPLPDLAPGDHTDVHIHFTAPLTSGAAVSRWLAVGPDGVPPATGGFGVWCLVHVTTLADTLAFEPLPD